MAFNCVVLDTFHTSLGNVAILGFLNSKTPRIKMVFKNESNLKWEITGIGANRKLDSSNQYAKYDAESIWDCVLRPLDHSDSVKANDILEIISDKNAH
jgi:hypothetical protein